LGSFRPDGPSLLAKSHAFRSENAILFGQSHIFKTENGPLPGQSRIFRTENVSLLGQSRIFKTENASLLKQGRAFRPEFRHLGKQALFDVFAPIFPTESTAETRRRGDYLAQRHRNLPVTLRSNSRTPPSNFDMKTTLTIAVLSVLFVTALSGCNEPATIRGAPPATLTSLIADADHIVVTNRFAGREPRYRGFSLTISGDEARRIVRAIAASEHCPPTDSAFDWDLKFYRGEEFLAGIQLQGSHFVFEGEEYFDGRTLERLYHDLLKRTEKGDR
jgi:hypothetical protein